MLDVESGYCNGQAERPSYEQVCSGDTGCAEVVRLVFDPAVIPLEQILHLLRHPRPDPAQPPGPDLGTQYRSGIYCSDEQQLRVARDHVAVSERERVFARPIVTEVKLLANYWPAEAYHQDFSSANPNQGYCLRWPRPGRQAARGFRRLGAGLCDGAGAAAGRRRTDAGLVC